MNIKMIMSGDQCFRNCNKGKNLRSISKCNSLLFKFLILVFFISILPAVAKIRIVRDLNLTCSDTMPSDRITVIQRVGFYLTFRAIYVDSTGNCSYLEGGDTSIDKIVWYADGAVSQIYKQFNDDIFSPCILDTLVHRIKVINNQRDSFQVSIQGIGLDSMIYSDWLSVSQKDSVFVQIFSGSNEVVQKPDMRSLFILPRTCNEPRVMVLITKKTSGIQKILFKGNDWVRISASTVGTAGAWINTWLPELTKRSASPNEFFFYDTVLITSFIGKDSIENMMVIKGCVHGTGIDYKQKPDRVFDKLHSITIQGKKWNSLVQLLNSEEKVELFDLSGKLIGNISKKVQTVPLKNVSKLYLYRIRK